MKVTPIKRDLIFFKVLFQSTHELSFWSLIKFMTEKFFRNTTKFKLRVSYSTLNSVLEFLWLRKLFFYFFILTIKLRHFSFIRRFYFGESRTSNNFIFFSSFSQKHSQYYYFYFTVLLSHSSFHLYNFILPRELRWNRNF